MVRPPAYEDLSDEAFVAMFDKKLREREEEIREQAKAKKICFLGVR